MMSADERRPRSELYDGWLYGKVIEPLSAGLHAFVVGQLGAHTRVLDACCGTGRLTLMLAERSEEVVGVDLSPRNIAFAEARRRRHGVANARFEVADVLTFAARCEAPFDRVVTSMSLHEMPAAARLPVLEALASVGRELLVIDFRVPMPHNLAGWRNRAVELTAGPKHFLSFRDYNRRGGLDPLIAQAGLTVVNERFVDGQSLAVKVLRR